MSNIVCNRTVCMFNGGGGFCKKEYVFLTPAAACAEWYTKNGEAYMFPLYEQLKFYEEEEKQRNDNNREYSESNSGTESTRDAESDRQDRISNSGTESTRDVESDRQDRISTGDNSSNKEQTELASESTEDIDGNVRV